MLLECDGWVFAGVEFLSLSQFFWNLQACITVGYGTITSTLSLNFNYREPLLLYTQHHASIRPPFGTLNCLVFDQPLFFLNRPRQLKHLKCKPKDGRWAADMAHSVTRNYPKNIDKKCVCIPIYVTCNIIHMYAHTGYISGGVV